MSKLNFEVQLNSWKRNNSINDSKQRKKELKAKTERQWHYVAVKKLSAFLHRITSKNKDDFYCLNCLDSFRTENKAKSYQRLCRNEDSCRIVMPLEKDNIL